MGWNDPDVYSQPEHFGLSIVGDIQWDEPCYSYNLTVVWKDDSGNLYYDDDSGCSCPSPFERRLTLESIGPSVTWHAIADHLITRAQEAGVRSKAKGDVIDLIDRTRRAVEDD